MSSSSSFAIIVDLLPPMDKTTLKTLTNSLQNVICLSLNLKTPKINAITLLTMTSFAECLFPLQILKGNLNDFNSSLNTLNDTLKDDIKENTHECIAETLTIVLNQWEKLEKENSQLEIVIFTSRTLNSFADGVERAVAELDVVNVKRIQVVGICDLLNPGIVDSCSGVVDLIRIRGDKFQFDNYFKNWLHDYVMDQEKVHVVLPSVDTDDVEMIIKCDVFDRIINPELLPVPELFLLTSDSIPGKPKVKNYSTKPIENRGIYRLVAIKLIEQTGICDSTVFGMPAILVATSCWKMELAEVEKNRDRFVSLCQFLDTKKLVLICKMESFLNSAGGHFVIFASSQSLLVKSIAVDEILLPSVRVTSSQEVVSEIREEVDKRLGYLKIEPVYRVTDYEAKLFECLNAGFTKSVKKVTFEAPLRKGLFKRGATRRNLAEKLNL